MPVVALATTTPKDQTATAGQAVLFAGGTVMIAILGLVVAGMPAITAIGVAISIVVAVAMAAGRTPPENIAISTRCRCETQSAQISANAFSPAFTCLPPLDR